MAKNQTAASKKAAAKTPAAVAAAPAALKEAKMQAKGEAQMHSPKPGRIVPPGTMQTRVGPAGGKLVEASDDKHAVTEEQRQGERRAQSTIAQFANQMMQTPAAHTELTEEQKRKAEFDQKMADLAKEFGQPLPTAPKARATSARVQQNDITRPAAGTKTGDVWDCADEITKSNGGQAAQIAQVREHKKLAGWNEHTIKTQFARWRAFHGVVGRAQVVKIVPAPIPEGQYDGLPTQ